MELKILGLADFLVGRLNSIQREIYQKRVDMAKKRELSRFGSLIPLLIFEFTVSVWLILLVIAKKISVGSLEMYLRSLRSAQSNLTALVSSFLQVYENYIYVVDLVWFLNLESKIERTAGGVKVSRLKNYLIEFKDVWFRYRQDQSWAIRGVSFRILPGEKIALVGLNGAGKSTLIKLLARFYDPQKGEILVGGVSVKELDLADWRSKLAVLFQEFETYPFSVKEAIGYGDVGRMRRLSDIKKALKQTGMLEYVEGLPLKFDNPLHPEFDGGVKPSIGQWQRLGISRMLFRTGAKVLIMDEPTSNVDPEAEENIFGELVRHSRGRILLFVTQRFSTVRVADRIFVVDKGKIIEQGTHKELLALGGKYAGLFRLQARGYQ